MDDVNPGLGHNNPPDESALIQERLDERTRELRARAASLLDAETRLPEISDDGVAGKVGDMIRLITAACQTAELDRKREKEPHLAAARTVDGYYKQISEPLADLKTRVSRRLTAYLTAKAERERQAREAEAKRLREEAEKQAAAAAQVEAAAPAAAAIVMEQALATEVQAAQASRAAAAKPAELSRTRGEVGSVASLKSRWIGEVSDRAALDLEALRPYLPVAALQTALNGAIKAGVRDVRGCRIFQEQTAAVR